MKKYLLYLITFSLMTSCNNKKTNDGTTLVSYDIQIPDDLIDKAKNGTINSYEFKGVFPDISASFSIFYETITIDTTNSVIKSVKVVLDKGSDNCLFHSYSIDKKLQFNAGNRENYSTYTNVLVGYVKESPFSTKSENAVYVISSDGTCKILQ